MTSPFVAEIRLFAGNFAPTGWAGCDGQLMPISQNTALFSLLGTTYGGDGKATFALPNFEGSGPIGQGQGSGLTDRFLGEIGGTQNVTLISTEMPQHVHTANCSNAGGDQPSPSAHLWSKPHVGKATDNVYVASGSNNTAMNPFALNVAGSSFPHNNMMPFLCVFFIIALQGVFPARP